MLISLGHRLMELTMGECLQCKLKRLQEESDEEFRAQYGFKNLTPRAPMQGKAGGYPVVNRR